MFPKSLKNAQRVLQAHAGYKGGIDGQPGPVSLAAAWRISGVAWADVRAHPREWTAARQVILAAQVILDRLGFLPGPPDGLWGTRTDGAYLQWMAKAAGVPFPDRDGESDFGRQADVVARFGPAGAAACTAGKIVVPWRMVLAWDTAQQITKISCHVDAAASGQRAFDRIAATYDPVQIRALGLHLYGGCYNYRLKRGGRSLSMHAFGLAIDFDPARNRLPWHAQSARLGQPDAAAFWSIWESEGWTSLGRARNYDWMHVQAPAL